MKFNVASRLLYTHASAVSKIINSKNAISILNSFLIKLQGDRLTILASDMENSLEARLTVTEPEGEGAFCIDARRLVDLLKEMPDQGITIEIHPDTMMVDISYPNGKYNLVAISGDEYPVIQSPVSADEETITVTAPADRLIRGLDLTMFAVSTDLLRPNMTGVLWDFKPECLVFAATDTRKLVKFTDNDIKPGAEGSMILPVKTAAVFKNACAKEGEVKVTVGSKGVTFESNAFTLNSVLIKGTFPPYDRVIPKSNPYTLSVDRQAMQNAVRRVGGFVSADHGLIKFNISPELLTLRAADNDYCLSAREAVPCSFNGNEMVIGFGAPYLTEILAAITTGDVVISLSDPSRPGVFTPSEDVDNTEQLMLLMPMTVID